MMGEALLSISPAGRGHLVKMLITLEPATGMRNGDEASPSIISVGRGILSKILITLELHGKC